MAKFKSGHIHEVGVDSWIARMYFSALFIGLSRGALHEKCIPRKVARDDANQEPAGENCDVEEVVRKPLRNIRQISAGSSHACAVMVDNTVRCLGVNSSGQFYNQSAP